MIYSRDQAYYEAAIGRAHRGIFAAIQAAMLLGHVADAADLEMLLRELTRIGDAAISRKPINGIRITRKTA
jgi:hypothetical protein